MHSYFVRLGSLGEIYAATSSVPFARGRRVILRTRRGVELAEIVSERPASTLVAENGSQDAASSSLSILRATTDEDELLIGRLEKHKRDALESCRQALRQAGSEATLLDVDQVFDGGTLVMHFLGSVDDATQAIADSVAQQYESVVGTEAFAKLLSEGCGPDCGTSDGGGCGGSCSGCAVASACRTA